MKIGLALVRITSAILKVVYVAIWVQRLNLVEEGLLYVAKGFKKWHLLRQIQLDLVCFGLGLLHLKWYKVCGVYVHEFNN